MATRRVGPTGWGRKGSAHLSRRGPFAPAAQAQSSCGRQAPRPAPPTPNRPGAPRSPRPARAAPRPRLLGVARPAPARCTPGSAASPLALARSRPGLLSSEAPGIKATADTGLRAEGLAAEAPGPPGGADRCGARPRRPRRPAGGTGRRSTAPRGSRPVPRLGGQILGGPRRQWGQRGRRHLPRSVGLGVASWFLPACALALHPVQGPPRTSADTGAWARMEELPVWSLFSDLRAIKCICPFISPSQRTSLGQKENPSQKPKMGWWGEAAYLGACSGLGGQTK